MHVDFSNITVLERDTHTPVEFISIKREFEKVKESNTPILMENKELKLTQSVVLNIDWIGDYFCRGYVTYYRGRETDNVPYTINYSDVFVEKYGVTNIIFKGEDPFATVN